MLRIFLLRQSTQRRKLTVEINVEAIFHSGIDIVKRVSSLRAQRIINSQTHDGRIHRGFCVTHSTSKPARSVVFRCNTIANTENDRKVLIFW